MKTSLRFGILGGATLAALTALSLLDAPSATAAAQTKVAKATPTAAQASGTYAIDKAHTDITFTIVHLGLTKTHGRFKDFDGTIKVDGAKPENSSVEFTIQAASIDTSNAQRDAHLKNKDFFDTEKHPEITFKSTKIAKRKGGWNAVGNLTMRGVTKPVTLPFTVAGPVEGLDKQPHIGISTSVVLNRRDFGIVYGPNAVLSDKVNVVIEIDAVKQPAKTASR